MERVQIDYPPPTPQRHQPFRLSWWMLVPVLIIAGLELRSYTVSNPGADPADAIGRVTGRIIGTILFSLLLAWFAWLVSRRSRRAANYTFAISMLLMGLAALSMQATEEAVASKAVAAQIDALRQKQVEAQAAQTRLIDAGGVDIRLPRDEREVAARIALVDEAIAKFRELIEAGDRAPAELADRLTHRAIKPDRRAEILADLERRASWPARRELLAALVQSLERGRELLIFLHERPGRWSVDVEKEQIVFVADEDVEQFNRLSAASGEAVDEFERLRAIAADRSAPSSAD